MDFKVNLKLQKKNEHGETMFEFIADTEKDFGLPESNFENICIDSLEQYIDYLD